MAGGIIAGLIATLSGVYAWIMNLPNFAKIIMFLITIQLSLRLIGGMLCPASVYPDEMALINETGVFSTTNYCYQPEIFQSMDSEGNYIPNTGIKVFSGDMANVITLIVIFWYILFGFGINYFRYAGGVS